MLKKGKGLQGKTHLNSNRGLTTKIKKLKSKTANNIKKRKEQRSGFGEFFKKHIEIIVFTHARCSNCGDRLTGNAAEVAHIFSKTENKHPEVALEDDNIVYLCSPFSNNRCHSKFDGSIVGRKDMKVFPLISDRYNRLKKLLKRSSNETKIFEE